MVVMAVPIAVAGAAFVALGFVIQQRVAAKEPASERLSFRLLVSLAKKRTWLLGIACMVIGQLLGAAALGMGGLALVTPLMAVNLVFALSFSAAWRRCRPGVRELAGALLLVGGLAAFIASGDPRGGSSAHITWSDWLLAGGAISATAFALVAVGRRRCDVQQATLVAGAAGTLYGLQDALTTRTIATTGGGFVHMFTSWPVFALLGVSVTALMLGQSAFEAAPLDASLPAVTAAEPITAIALGAGIFGERLDVSTLRLAIDIGGLACMFVGVYLVATSPVVTGDPRVSPSEPPGSQRSSASRAPRSRPEPVPWRISDPPLRRDGNGRSCRPRRAAGAA
ncbi:MAG TPA: DMT family transporter [Acidimicrobiales bacterium]|nr:DMT family transporter [Acidimicrobiales bacterium]